MIRLCPGCMYDGSDAGCECWDTEKCACDCSPEWQDAKENLTIFMKKVRVIEQRMLSAARSAAR